MGVAGQPKFTCAMLCVRNARFGWLTIRNTKFYSGALEMNYAKIYTNENFPLYGSLESCREDSKNCYLSQLFRRVRVR